MSVDLIESWSIHAKSSRGEEWNHLFNLVSDVPVDARCVMTTGPRLGSYCCTYVSTKSLLFRYYSGRYDMVPYFQRGDVPFPVLGHAYQKVDRGDCLYRLPQLNVCG